MVGTTRARVNKFMNGFKKKGFVHYNGGLQINSALIIGTPDAAYARCSRTVLRDPHSTLGVPTLLLYVREPRTQ